MSAVIRRDLFYSEQCAACRHLARIASAASLGFVRRVPLGSEEGLALQRRRPEWRGQPLLVEGARTVAGPAILVALPGVVLRCVREALRRAPRRSRS